MFKSIWQSGDSKVIRNKSYGFIGHAVLQKNQSQVRYWFRNQFNWVSVKSMVQLSAMSCNGRFVSFFFRNILLLLFYSTFQTTLGLSNVLILLLTRKKCWNILIDWYSFILKFPIIHSSKSLYLDSVSLFFMPSFTKNYLQLQKLKNNCMDYSK